MILPSYKSNQSFFLLSSLPSLLPFLSSSLLFNLTHIYCGSSLGTVLSKGHAVTYKNIWGRDGNIVSGVMGAYIITPLSFLPTKLSQNS